MFSIITKSLKTGVLTEADPFGTQASFGFPVIDFSRCTACDDCARIVPDRRDQDGGARAGPEDALAVVRRVHPVPRVCHGVPRAGGQRFT